MIDFASADACSTCRSRQNIGVVYGRNPAAHAADSEIVD